MSFIVAALIALASIMFPGFFLALALLKKTKLNLFEITAIGFIFGMIFPPAMTWLESYLIPYVHAFSFSAGLYAVNVVVLTIIGILLSLWQGAITLGMLKPKPKEAGTIVPTPVARAGNGTNWAWYALMFLMILTFATRLMSIATAPKFFEFDPYFDLLSTESILTHGTQWLYDHSAWPTVSTGSVHRIEPLMPYLEAYWYDISNPPTNAISTNLMSLTSSFYPPIVAALLVFVIFMFIYHIYGEFPAVMGAALVAAMPALITTFIAGEQLLEPWGIFSLFFFYMAYLLATQNPKETRYAILAGIAFASTFLGAHYYTVDAGVFAVYILLQGIVNTIRNESNKDFYKMNIIVIAIIIAFFIVFDAYGSVLTDAVPEVLHIPVILAFPVMALVAVFLGDFITNKVAPEIERSMGAGKRALSRLSVWAVLVVIIALLVFLTPLGSPIDKYLALSSHYTTPSTPLFMTVQEYEPTGFFTFDFGSAGFGIIGTSIFGVSVIIWAVLILFSLLVFYDIYKRNSKGSLLAFAAILPLALAGMVEVKYLPHFGVGYILAIGLILGEAMLYIRSRGPRAAPDDTAARSSGMGKMSLLFIADFIVFLIIGTIVFAGLSLTTTSYIIIFAVALVLSGGLGYYYYSYVGDPSTSSDAKLSMGAIIAVGVLVVLLESISLPQVFAANASASCTKIANAGNSVGFDLFCNTIPDYWLSATAWMYKNVGPFQPRILSWWDYGDWINWFGNSNAVLRGDNSVAKLDYDTAARYVLGSSDGYGPSNLANFSDSVQAEYVLFDDQLTAKWQALNFLACVDINQTSRTFAIQEANGTSEPYVLGQSQCELDHSPAYALIAINTSSLSSYCQMQNKSVTALRTTVAWGNLATLDLTPVNQTYCTDISEFESGQPTALLYQNGTKSNILIELNQQLFDGTTLLGSQQIAIATALYLPNGPNDTITDAPSEFYNSNYYRGFYLGELPGFTIAYPSNFTGVNYVNGIHQVVIYKADNYTGGLPPVTPKPSWVINNFTMPG